jgi:hypothetical protein
LLGLASPHTSWEVYAHYRQVEDDILSQGWLRGVQLILAVTEKLLQAVTVTAEVLPLRNKKLCSKTYYSYHFAVGLVLSTVKFFFFYNF